MLFPVNAHTTLLRASSLCLSALATFASPLALADSLVRVDTDAGSFALQLFDSSAPGTVENFLGYVDAGSYDGTLIHRSVSNFVIQGGGFSFEPTTGGFNSVMTLPAIRNEFGVSNTRGTIAMAKLGGDPDSATSQWFINLGNNSANLDNQNGGFTVFGKVLGEGMAVVDSINSLRTVSIDGLSVFSEIPYLSLTGTTTSDADWVDLEMRSLSTSSKFSGGTLAVALDAGDAGKAMVDFVITQDSPTIVIALVPSTALFIDATVDKMASFDTTSGTMIIPELEIEGSIAYRNLVFQLADPATYSFTLESFE